MVVKNLRVLPELLDILDGEFSFNLYLSTGPRIPYLCGRTTPAQDALSLDSQTKQLGSKRLRSTMR